MFSVAGKAVAVLLAARSRLHRFVRSVLTEGELDDGLIFIHDLDAFLSLEEEQALEAAFEGNR